MVELFANSGDPNQMPHSVVSDLGLHCLPVTFLGVSRLKWINANVQIGLHAAYSYSLIRQRNSI